MASPKRRRAFFNKTSASIAMPQDCSHPANRSVSVKEEVLRWSSLNLSISDAISVSVGSGDCLAGSLGSFVNGP